MSPPIDVFAEPVPYLPIAQLRREDVPGFIGPDDADLMQALWCPVDHDGDWAPDVIVRWRREADVAEVLEEPPMPFAVSEAGYEPWLCVLAPERVVEYDLFAVWDRGYDVQLLAEGAKVGGFPSWALNGPHEMVCECGSPMRFLMSFGGYEGPDDPVGVEIGRGYELWTWYCAASFDHPTVTTMQ